MSHRQGQRQNTPKLLLKLSAEQGSLHNHPKEVGKLQSKYGSLNTGGKSEDKSLSSKIGPQLSLDLRKKTTNRSASKPQKSFSSEKNQEGFKEPALANSGIGMVPAHKRTKTLGEKPEFILGQSRPVGETQGSALMKKLSEKLQLDIGRLTRDKGLKNLDLLKKKPSESGQKALFEQSSLARKIAEMKTGGRPLTDRVNFNHIGSFGLTKMSAEQNH